MPPSKGRLGDLPPVGRKWDPGEIELIWDDPALLGLILGRDLLVSYTGDLSPRHAGKNIEPRLHSHWIKSVWLDAKPLEAHRGSMKTTAVSEVGTIWNWSLAPLERQDDRIMLVRGTFTAAKSSMETIARNMKHPLIVSLFETLYGEGCTDTVYCRENEILYKLRGPVLRKDLLPPGASCRTSQDSTVTGSLGTTLSPENPSIRPPCARRPSPQSTKSR